MATLRLTDAQAALVAEHTDVIDQVIVRYFRPAFGVDYQRADAWQDGWIGLADAARRFDPSYEVPFSAMARPRVHGAIADGIGRLRGISWRRAERFPRGHEQRAANRQAVLSLDVPVWNDDSLETEADRLEARTAPVPDLVAARLGWEQALQNADMVCDDDLDRAALAWLALDASTSVADYAAELGVPWSTLHYRIIRLRRYMRPAVA